MKRCWFGVGALVLLLILGLLSSAWIQRYCHRITNAAGEAALAANAENWPAAAESLDQVRLTWENGRSLGAILTDHAPMEQIDVLLALLDTALTRRDGAAFHDLCAQLIQSLNALAEAHQLNWGNLL